MTHFEFIQNSSISDGNLKWMRYSIRYGSSNYRMGIARTNVELRCPKTLAVWFLRLDRGSSVFGAYNR